MGVSEVVRLKNVRLTVTATNNGIVAFVGTEQFTLTFTPRRPEWGCCQDRLLDPVTPSIARHVDITLTDKLENSHYSIVLTEPNPNRPNVKRQFTVNLVLTLIRLTTFKPTPRTRFSLMRSMNPLTVMMIMAIIMVKTTTIFS